MDKSTNSNNINESNVVFLSEKKIRFREHREEQYLFKKNKKFNHKFSK